MRATPTRPVQAVTKGASTDDKCLRAWRVSSEPDGTLAFLGGAFRSRVYGRLASKRTLNRMREERRSFSVRDANVHQRRLGFGQERQVTRESTNKREWFRRSFTGRRTRTHSSIVD